MLAPIRQKMRNTIILITLLIFGNVHSQTDKNGNPIFNSVSINEKEFDNFKLISNYYTLENNIENKQSSVFVSENPSLNEIEKSATELPSDFFIVTKNQLISNMILIVNEPKRVFVVIDIGTNEQTEFKCNLKGDITENRAKEIVDSKFDENAKIKNGKLYFNGKKFKIITNLDIEKAVLSLINKENLGETKASEIKIPTQEELKTIILSETKEGGKLDFFTEIKGKEYDGVQIKPGVFSTKLGIALYKWGRATFENGVNTVEDSYKIFAEFKGRELNQREKEYIKLGFNKELEK